MLGCTRANLGFYEPAAQRHIRKFITRLVSSFILVNNDKFHFSDRALDIFSDYPSSLLACSIVADPNSRWMIRQGFASVYHFSKLCSATSLGAFDILGSAVGHAAAENVKAFKSDHAIRRFYKRIFFALRRNGGVYEELGEILKDFVSVKYQDIMSRPPVTEADPPSWISTVLSFDWLRNDRKNTSVYQQFRDEHGMPLYDVFRSIDAANNWNGDICSVDAVLRSGKPVTIHYMPSHIKRMRNFDLLPLRFLKFVMPFKAERAVLNHIYDQLDFSLAKERHSRLQFLDSYQGDLPFVCPAPIPELCTKNIMVTERAANAEPMTKTAVIKAGYATAKMFSNSMIFSDLSSRNLVNYGSHGVGLKKFSTLATLDLHSLSHDTKKLMTADKLTSFLSDQRVDFQRYSEFARDMIGKYPKTTLPMIQAAVSLKSVL